MRYIIPILMVLLLCQLVSATLSCTISNSTCADTDVFHISALTNAHAEQNNESNYSYVVCCKETTNHTLSTNGGTIIIRLSASTNAHVELGNESNYAYPIYLNASNGSIVCSYQTASCAEACLGTVSTNITGLNTNLHIADCSTDPYATRICCNYSNVTIPTAGNVSVGGPSIKTPNQYEQPPTGEQPLENKIPKTNIFGMSIIDIGKLVYPPVPVLGWIVTSIVAVWVLALTVYAIRYKKAENKLREMFEEVDRLYE